MAKQKSGKIPKKKVEAQSDSELIVRFRTTDDGEAHDGLQYALAGFRKKAAAKAFDTWLQAKHKDWLEVSDTECTQ